MIGNNIKYTNINHNRASLNTMNSFILHTGDYMWAFCGRSSLWDTYNFVLYGRLFLRMGDKKTWYNDIGLCAQNIDTSLGSIVHNNIGLSDHGNLTHFSFCISISNLNLVLTMLLIHNCQPTVSISDQIQQPKLSLDLEVFKLGPHTLLLIGTSIGDH